MGGAVEREETRGTEGTRARIVAAAFRVLARDGYGATTMKSIAREAGVALGLAHYYFDSREDVLVAAVDYGRARRFAEQPPPASSTLEDAYRVVDVWRGALDRHRDFYVLVFDLYGVGLHNPKIAAAVRRFIDEDRSYIEEIVRAALTELGLAQDNVHALTGAIWGGLNGILLQKLNDDAFDLDAALDALVAMILARVAQLAS